jgi:hypothetical protein
LFFDIEGLIVELHSEEYAAMSPTTLEVSDWVLGWFRSCEDCFDALISELVKIFLV